MIILIVSLISFIFEYVFNFLFHGSIFSPLVILTSIILLEPYFCKDRKRYFVYCFLIGFFYDLIYTGNYFLDSGLFLFIGIFVCFINSNMSNNFFVFLLELLFLIVFYRVFSFFIFFINGFVPFSLFFKSIYCSFLLNIIYGTFLYFVLCFVSKKLHIKRICQLFFSYFLLVI